MFPSLESWASSLGYVVEVHCGVFFVHKERESAVSAGSREEVMDFILGAIRNSCCGVRQ